MLERRSTGRQRYIEHYRKIHADGRCFYCGDRATGRDPHVPVAFIDALYEICRSANRKPLLPACRECCGLAGSMPFRTLGQKRRFVQQRLRAKHQRMLRLPNWDDEEIAGLGFGMRTSTVNAVNGKTRLIMRLIWPRTAGSLEEALFYLQRRDAGVARYVPKPANRQRDAYEAEIRPVLAAIDERYAGALTEMVASLNARSIPAHGGADWTVSRLQRALWRLGLSR